MQTWLFSIMCIVFCTSSIVRNCVWLHFKFSQLHNSTSQSKTSAKVSQCTVANTYPVNITTHTYMENIYSISKDALHISTHMYIISYCVLLECLCGKIVNKICLVTVQIN